MSVQSTIKRKTAPDILARQRIIDGLGFPPRGDKPLLAQLGKMLRNRRLRQANGILQGRYRAFALVQFAEQHQPVAIGHRFQQGFGRAGTRIERGQVHARQARNRVDCGQGALMRAGAEPSWPQRPQKPRLAIRILLRQPDS